MQMLLLRFLAFTILLQILRGLTQITNQSVQNIATGYAEYTFYQFSFNFNDDALINISNDNIKDGQPGIEVVFPPQIGIQYFPNILECYYRIGADQNQQVDCDYDANRKVNININRLINGDYQVAVGLVQNPTGITGTSFFKLCMMLNDVELSCNDTFGKVAFYQIPAKMIEGNVQQKSSLVLNAGSSWAFSFTPKGIYEKNLYNVRVSFPKGFSTKQAQCIVEGGTSEILTKILYNQYMIECLMINIQMKSKQKIRILNMINPTSSIDLQQFSIEILLSSSNIVLERITFDPQPSIQLAYSNMQISLEQSNQFKLSNTTFIFKFNPVIPLNQSGSIKISFTEKWKLWGKNCTLISGLKQYANSQPTCSLNNYQNSYFIENFADIIPNNQVVVSLIAQTPSIEGSYDITVTTLNKDNKIVDSAVISAITNSTFGSLSKYEASALIKQVKLKAGYAGSFEAIFFLKNKLPQSNYNTIGRIQIKIFPKINKPSPNNGIVKCYFFGKILATQCDFDDQTYSTHTVINILTPEAYEYQESQIPITIISEGSKLSSNQGILLDPLVKRYLFHFHMYNTTNPDAEPTEVYFQEWIPDPFEIPDSDIYYRALVQERNEYTHLKLKVKHQISMVSMEKNYVFRVTFLNDEDVWDVINNNGSKNLDPNSYPCYLQGKLGKEYPYVKCNLYTHDKNPFIQAYGFDTLDIIKGDQIQLDIPNIFIQNVMVGSWAKIRFSVMEQTPGMIEEYVELYFKELAFQVQENSQASYTFNPNIATTLIPDSFVNDFSDLRFSWTSSVRNPEYLIYEIDQIGFYDIQTGKIPPANCDNNECIKFEKKIHQVVISLPITQDENIISNIKGIFQNANYAGSFQFRVRALRDGRVVNKHSYYVNVSQKNIKTAIFDIETQANVLNDINVLVTEFEENEFYVKFLTETYLPDDSLIKLRLQNVDMQQLDRHNQYCMLKLGLQPLANYPIKCIIDGNSILISQFQAVPAKTIIQINFRLKNKGYDFSPLISIDTYYGPQNTALVDYLYDIPSLSKPIRTNNVKSQNYFKVLPEAIRSESREKNYIGPVIFDYQLGNLKKLNWIKSFKTPREYGNDSLICLVNEIRLTCTYSINPLTVAIIMKSNAIPVAQSYRLSISTEYISPLDGILHPMTEGYYPINIELQDEQGVSSQQTRYMFIKGQKLQFFYVESMIRNQKRANMFYIRFRVNKVVKSYQSGARIYIEFPTQDNQGNPQFDLNLGGYQNTGDDVGCRFVSKSTNAIGPVSNLRCRLIKSQSIGVPAVVEIINFNGLVENTEVEMWIAKIFNPPNYNYPNQAKPQVMDAYIVVNIFERDLSTGDISYIHYDYFNLFLDIRDDPILSDAIHPYSSSTPNQVWQTGSKVSDNQKSMVNPVFYDKTPFLFKDFYIVELPVDTLDAMLLDWEMSSCNSNNYLMCLTFPQIGWIVTRAKIPLSQNTMQFNNDAIIKQLPLSVPQKTTEYKAYVWQGRLFRGYVVNKISPQQWLQLVGDIKIAKLVHLESSYKLVKNRKHIEVNLNFTINHFVPSYGAIQIRFSNRINNIYPHCRSSITVGSGLAHSLGPYGNVGCLVQDQNSWVITGFQDIRPTQVVMITGFIDLPQDNISGYIGDLDIISYGSHQYSNIFQEGRLIEKTIAVPNSGFSLSNFVSKNLEDWDLLHIETTPLRINQRGPIRFKFQPAETILGNQGRIRVMFYEYSQLQYNDKRGGQFPYYKNSQYVCDFLALQTKQFHGCKVELVNLDETNKDHFNILFQLIPNSDILTNQDYILKITTIDGNGNEEGITFPSTALPYKVDISISSNNPASDSSYNYHSHLYYQVYGKSFAFLKFTSYITLKNEMNIFIIEFQPGQVVNSQDKLIIEFPTSSIDGSISLFADDGGLGVQSMDQIKFDIIDSTFLIPSMECRLNKGLAMQKIPLKYVCTNFMNNGTPYTFTVTDKMKIAFQILNPSVTNGHLSIPAQVYIERPYKNANEKFIWDIVENAFYIHSWDPPLVTNLNGDFNIGSVTDTVCNMNTDFKFRPRNTFNLQNKNDDAYILKFKFELRDLEPLKKKTCKYMTTGALPNDCAILVNLRAFIVWPQATNDIVAPLQIITTGRKWWTLPYRDTNTSKLSIIGYACYIRNMWTEMVAYPDPYPDVQPQSVQLVSIYLQSRPVTAIWNAEKTDFIFEITSPYWYYVERVVVLFPANFQWKVVGNLCKENVKSEVEINNCWIEANPIAPRIWIDVAHKENYQTINPLDVKILRFETQMESFQIPQSAPQQILYSDFNLKFYTWSGTADIQPSPWRTTPPLSLDPLKDTYICFTDASMIRPGEKFPATPWNTDFQSDDNIEFDYSYHRYNDEFHPCNGDQRSPLKFDMILPDSMQDLRASVNYHTLHIYYEDKFEIPIPKSITDYIKDKLICYINNERTKCIDDTVNKRISMFIKQSGFKNDNIFISATSYDINDITKDGFKYKGSNGLTNFKYEMEIFGKPNIYYGFSQMFPAQYNTNNGQIQCPHRGIEDGELERSNNIYGRLNIIWLKLKFDRTDIQGLVILIRIKDEDGQPIPNANSFFSLPSGSNYPCSRGVSNGYVNSVRCIYEQGYSDLLTTPHKIHIFDFSYQVKTWERFGFMYNNQDFTTQNIFIDVVVQAFGGNPTFDNPYGNQFMGEMKFEQIIRLQTNACGANCNNVGNISARIIPSKPAFTAQNSLSFTNDCPANSQAHAIFEVVLQRKSAWDSNYIEECEIDPRLNISEMYIYENYSWDNTDPTKNDYVKKAYLYYDFSGGRSSTINLGFLKCKHYREPIYGYYSCVAPGGSAQGDTQRFDKITYNICEEATGGCATADTNEAKADLNTPDMDIYENGVDWKQDMVGYVDNMNTIALKLSKMVIGWTGNFQSVLTLTFPAYFYNNGKARPSSCQVIEGMRMSDSDKLAEPVKCEVLPNPIDPSSNAFMFKITNWDTIVDEEYVRILYKMSYMNFVDWSTYYDNRAIKIWANLYASNDAFNTGKNGHMAQRKLITVVARLQSPKDDGGLTVDSFQVVGSQTKLRLTSKNTGGEITFKDNTGACEYFPYFQLKFYGLQEIEKTISDQVKWEINGVPSTCIKWDIFRKSKGYVSMIAQFDKINDQCQFGQSWKNQVLTLEFTFNSIVKMDRNFWWVHFSLNEEYKPPASGVGCANEVMQLYGQNYEYSYINTVGTQTDVVTLSNQYNTITEIEFTITGLNTDIGLDTNVNKVLMMEFTGKDWINNPIYKTPDTQEFMRVNCLCRINTATDWTEKPCMRRTRQVIDTITYDPAVFIYVSAKTGDKVSCSIPEIQIGAIGTGSARNLQFKIIRPSLYEWYGPIVEAYKSPYTTIIPFTCVAAAAPAAKLTLTHNPADFYSQRQTTEIFQGYYDVQIKDIFTLDKPYVQVRNGELGPVMSTEFCSDSGIWDPTSIKVYNVHTHLLICRRINSMTTYATIGAGKNLQFEYFKSQYTTDYKYTVYVYGNQNLVHIQDSAPIPNSEFLVTDSPIFDVKNMIYSANNADDQAQFALTVSLKEFTLKDIRKGGRIEILIPRSQVSNIQPNCVARMETEIVNKLYCYVDNRDAQNWILVIHSLFKNIDSFRLLNVYFNMQNPSVVTQEFDFTVKLYYSWTSDTNFKLQMIDSINKQDFNLSEQQDGKIRLGNQNIKFYGFKVKQFVTGLQEARFYVKFLSQKALKLNFDITSIENKLLQPNEKLRVRLREYHPSILQKYSEIITPNKQLITNGFNIGAHEIRPPIKNAIIEVIISTIGDNSQIGLQKLDSDPAYYDGNLFVYDDKAKNEHQYLSKYRDYSTNVMTSALQLESFYFTNQIHNQITSFSIGMRIYVACTENYPRAYIELKFPQLNIATTFQGILSQGGEIPCQISVALEINPNRVNPARCLVYDIKTPSYSGMMVRVEEFKTFPANTLLTLTFDDWTLPLSTNEYLPIDIEFNFYNGWPSSNTLEYKRYFLLLKEVIVVDGFHASIWGAFKLGSAMFSKPASYQYGAKNQEMNAQVNDWLTPTARYDSSLSAGHKVRLVFSKGFIGGDNTPDSLTYYDNEQQLSLLFFNKKTRSAYISAPKQMSDPSGFKAQINIKSITNPYPYQRDQWSNDGIINYNLFFGDNFTFDGNGFHQVSIGELSLALRGIFQLYTKEKPAISCDAQSTHTVDVYPTYNNAIGQRVTMHFKIIHNVPKADRVKRQFQNVRMEFKQGVSSISACYIQSNNQDNKAVVHSHQYCTVDQDSTKNYNLAMNLYRVQEYDDVNPYSLFVEMVINDTQMLYEMTTIVSNGETEHYLQYVVPLVRVDPTQHPLKNFQFADEKYIPRYFELGYRELYTSLTTSTTWRLRFRFSLDIDMFYEETPTYTDPFTNSDYMRINLQVDALDAYIPTDPKFEWLDCFFVEELSLFGQYQLPLYSRCKVNRASNTNPIYYDLVAPRNKLTQGKKYVVHIKEHKISTSSFQLPRIPRKSEFIFMCFSPFGTSNPTLDTLITEISGQFRKAKINHITTSSGHYDIAEITFVPSYTLSAQTPGQEMFLQLEIDSIYYQKYTQNYQDFNIIESYQSDGLGEFINGNDHSFLFVPPNQNAKTIVNFGQYNNQQLYSGWIKVMLVNSNTLMSSSEYTFKVPMLKNPTPHHTSLNFRLSTILIKAGDQRMFTLDKYHFINHAYVDNTASVDMTSKNFKFSATNDVVQSSSMLIDVQLKYPISYNTNQKILLKYDNNLRGIDRGSLLKSRVGDCDIEVYDKIFLIVITPSSYQQGQGTGTSPNKDWSDFSFLNLITAADFRQQYGFWFVYLTKNGLTTNYYFPTDRRWLSALTDVQPNKKFTWIQQGFNTINSVNYYQLTISTPNRMPTNAYVVINLSYDMQAQELKCFPITNVNYGDYSMNNIGSLTCQKLTQSSYILTGLEQYTTSKTISLRFFAKNINGGYKINLQSVIFYGGSSPDNTIAVINNIDGVIVLSSNIGQSNLELIKHVSYPLNAINWQKLDFVFKNRATTMTVNSDYILRLVLPQGWFSAFGDRLQILGRYRLFDRQAYDSNKSYRSPQQNNKCINWVTSMYFGNTNNPLSINENVSFGIEVDYPPLSHYDIQKNTEYLFSVDSEGSKNPFQEGIYQGQPFLYAFYLEVLNSNTLLERTYNEFYLPPSEDINDTFRVQVFNKGAGQKTMMRFTFIMNYNLGKLGDEIHISFQTFDRYQRVFKDDLGLGFTSEQSNVGCSEAFGLNKISDNRIQCVVQKGSYSTIEEDTQRGKNVVVKIPISKNIADTEDVDFWLANIENPLSLNQVAGIHLSIKRNCRNDQPHFKCILYHGEYQYTTVTPIRESDYLINAGTFTATPNIVTSQASHSFSFTPRQNIQLNQFILIQYPSNHKNRNTCTSMIGQCIEFPESNWVLFKPNAVISKDLKISIVIDSMFNGLYRSNPDPNNYFIFQVFGNSGQIVEPLKIKQNYYDYITQNINGYIINTQTYDADSKEKWVFLKENYQNVAQLDILGLYVEEEIQFFRVQRPLQATKFIFNYCNATLLTPQTMNKPYPISFDCEIFDDYLMISHRDNQSPSFDNNFPKYLIRIYFKFIIDDKIPPKDGILPGKADPFIIYSCVQRCDDFTSSSNILEFSHVSKASVDWYIAPHQQPNLNQAGFYEKSFSQREAKINQNVGLSMLVKPNTQTKDCLIDKFVFTIPDEFQLPTKQNLDLCSIIGIQEVHVDQCTLTRRGGYSIISLILKEKFGDLAKIITINDKDDKNLFTSPPYPGTFYPIKLEMFCGSKLAETQYTNFTNVKGEDLDLSQIRVINSLDELTPQLYEFQFMTGKYATPIGYQRSLQNKLTDEIYSTITFVFEWIGDGYTIHPGYASDLGMDIQDGDEVGCTVKSGLVISLNSRLKCILQIGNNQGKMPMITVSGYEQIPPSTLVQILVTNIESIAKNLYTTVKIGIQITNPQFNDNAYFYNLVAIIPDPTTPINTPLIVQEVLVKVTGNNQIHASSNYEITFTTQNKALKMSDYFGFQLPGNFINTQMYDMTTISCSSTCSVIYIFPASSMIYLKPNSDIPMNTKVNFYISGVPNPNYAMQGDMNIKAFTFIDRKLDTLYQASFTVNFVPSSVFTSALVEASSQTGGEANLIYSFYFILGHVVPPNGSISIDFPKYLYEDPQIMASPLNCQLKGDVFSNTQTNKSYCKFVTSNRLSIFLVDAQLSPTTQYSVILQGITNPNINSNIALEQSFIFSSHFNSNPMLNQIISQKITPPPIFYLTQSKKCSLEVQPQIKNINMQSFYSFKFNCKTAIKDRTQVLIKLPYEYKIQNNPGDYKCSSFESSTLFTSKCILQEIQGEWILIAQIRSKQQSESFTVNVQLKNPSIENNAYAFSAQFIVFGQNYAQTDNSGFSYASIFDNTNIIKANNFDHEMQIQLQNVPINAAEPAFYIFKTPNDQSLTNIQETIIKFPTQFAKNLGDNLKCFLYQSNEEGFIFSIKNILELRAQQTVDSKNFKPLPCTSTYDYTISIRGVNEIYKQSKFKWNYILISNIYNPGQFYLDSYTIIQSNEGIAQWIFQGPLHYQITDIPKQLDIKKITAKFNSTAIQSPYTFETQSVYPFKKNIIAGIMIDLPEQFDVSQQPHEINCYSSISLNIKTNCKLYNNTILSWKESINIQDLYQFLYVESLINPSIADACSNPNIINPYYKISIIDLTTNEILATSNPRASLCMKYSSDLLSIKINGPYELVQGLSYDFTMEIERPANIMKLVPIYNNPQIEITPNILLFKDFELPAVIPFKLKVYSKAQIGLNSIKFQKYEHREGNLAITGDQYQLPPILKFEVIENIISQQPPLVIIQDFKAYSVGGQITTFVSIPEPPAHSMYLNIDATSSKNVTVYPTRLLITSQTSQLNFTIQYTGDKILDPIPFYFSLTSNEKIVHQVSPQIKYLVVTQSNIHSGHNVAKLDYINQLPLDSYYKSDLGKSVDKSLLNSELIKPEIIQIKQSDIQNNRALLNVITSQASTIKFILTYKNSKTPSSSEEVYSSTYKFSSIISEGYSHTKQYFPEAQDFTGEINLEGLHYQTSYDLLAVCYNGLGISQIFNYTFTTTYPNGGAVFHISLHNNTDATTLIYQLSQSLRINIKDMQILTSQQIIQDQGRRYQNDLFSFEVAIAPRSNGQDINLYLKQIISTENFEQSLKNYVTGFESYRVEPFSRKYLNSLTKLTDIQPLIESVSFYSASISVRVWEESLISGIVLEYDSEKKINNVISQQIILGLDENNNPVDEYWSAKDYSNASNNYVANLFFDNLRDGSDYLVFITASNIMPYPDQLKYMRLPDDQVIKLNFTTPVNLNVDHCMMINQLKSINSKVIKIIEKRFETDREFGYCKKVQKISRNGTIAFLK